MGICGLKIMYSKITEKELINLVKNKDDELALKELASRHSGILYNQSRKYSLPFSPIVNANEFYENRLEVVYEACKTFSPDRAQFNTHVGLQMRWHCSHQLAKLVPKEKIYEESFDLERDENSAEFNLKNSLQLSITDNHNRIEEYFQLINEPRILEIFKLRYLARKTWKEIEKVAGYSHTFCMVLHQKGLEIIKNKIKRKVEFA